MFLNYGNLVPLGTFDNVWRHVILIQLGVEVKDASKHPIIHTAASTTKNDLVPNIKCTHEINACVDQEPGNRHHLPHGPVIPSGPIVC